MPTVDDVLAQKGHHVHSVAADITVLLATQIMNQYKIGALVVSDEQRRVVGMFTERDVLRRVVAEQRDPATTQISDVMTREVICVPPGTDLDDVASLMKNRRIRHLPVCHPDGTLVGMVSIGDVNATYAHNQEEHISFLNQYIYGRV